MDWATVASWMPFSLLGAATSLGVMGIHLNLNNLLDAPCAPHVCAIHLLPLAMFIPAALGSLGPSLLASCLGFRMPAACTATIGFAGLATGLGAAILPFLLAFVQQYSHWIHAHFVLSNWPLRIMQLALLLVVCTLPFAGLGFTGRLMHVKVNPKRERESQIRLGGRRAVRPAIALGVLTGMIAGILIAMLLATRPASLLPAASLPMLLLAVIAGRLPDFPPAIAATKPT